MTWSLIDAYYGKEQLLIDERSPGDVQSHVNWAEECARYRARVGEGKCHKFHDVTEIDLTFNQVQPIDMVLAETVSGKLINKSSHATKTSPDRYREWSTCRHRKNNAINYDNE